MLCRNLKSARESLDKTQSEVADVVGISREMYNRIECGRVDPNIYTLLAIANVLNCNSLDELLKDEKEITKRRI